MNNAEKKLFQFDEIFEFKRGSRLTEIEQINGETAYISSTKKNNGIYNYITPPEKMKVYKNKMTLSNSGSVGYLFFHDYNFVASDHVTVIWLKNKYITLTKEIALYLKPILESIKYKYNFAREISNRRIEKEKILLPATNEGLPDWDYMGTYIKNIYTKVKFKKLNTRNKPSIDLDINSWSNFILEDIFEIYTGRDLIYYELIPGEHNVIGNGKSNNGITCTTIDLSNYDKYKSYKLFSHKNTISLADRGNFFATVQSSDFYIGTRVKALILREKKYQEYLWKLDKNINFLKFIAVVINIEFFRFSYGRVAGDRLGKLKIKLPYIIEDGEKIPDFEYMDKYIKFLPFGEKIYGNLNDNYNLEY
ncbi:restriction endonuclease subunit S [Terrisporobacter vanillatitrophus]|uniref:restriction endonuclease subunit S n=1 Tax=Terrisporobacter vanillatitrophus TaxID=3058402 RepID=UPI0033673863